MNLLCRFSDDLTISPAWPVLHTRVELHQNKNLQKRTIEFAPLLLQVNDTNLVCWKKIEVIWRVGNHISFAGCIWTCAVVAEPEHKIFFTFVNFLLRLLIFQAVCCLGFCKSKSYTLVWLKLSCGFYRVSTKTKTKYGFSFAFVGGSFPIIWTFTTKDPSSQFETIVHCANM